MVRSLARDGAHRQATVFMHRILLLTYEFAPFHGGIARVAEGMAEGAVACGLEPTVFAPDYSTDQRAGDGTRPYRVVRFEGSFGSMTSLRRMVRFTAGCRRVIARERPDLVHGIDPPAQLALTMLSRFGLAPPYGLTIHGTELLRYRREPLPRAWMSGAFARGGALWTVSEAVHGLLHRDFRVASGRSFVAHPGIAAVWFDAARADPMVVRRRWGVAESAHVVLTIARRVPEKGQDRVLAGIAALPEALRDRIAYVVAGTGPAAYARQLQEAADRAGMRLVLLEGLSDAELVDACDAADLFAMLSRQTPKRLEGFGLTYIEAGARGLPSIACATGGVAEAVRHGETGTVLPGDAGPEQIAESLQHLLCDDATRRALGRNAAAYARTLTYEATARTVYSRFGAILGV
jgi:phosphatidyl-myo-inositol dimannoside synthase